MPEHSALFRVRDAINDNGKYDYFDVTVEEGAFNVCINVPGYGDHASADGHGTPVILEFRNGVPYLVVWADVNVEDPTHEVCLAGAAEALRKE